MNERDEIVNLNPPLEERDVESLGIGDLVEISGTMVTARDEAYERILETARGGGDLPVNLEGGVVYHCGPLVESEDGGWRIVAAGPTTSARLDDMQVEFVRTTGVRCLIGKGGMSADVSREVGGLGCVYLAFPGGAAALAADAIESVRDVIWLDLGIPEAVWVLEVEGFGPLTVATDVEGESLYRRT